MIKVGAEISGWCPRCKLNQYMNVAATDGREVFSTTCRTCHNTNKHRPERSAEELKEEAWKKLSRVRKRKVVNSRGAPQVVNKPRRGGAIEAPTPQELAQSATHAAAAGEQARWRELTKDLGFRDGKPYKIEKTYAVGDVMMHKRHGMGIVQSLLHDQACMVLFRTGEQPIEMSGSSD
jgi:hypothetical protein